MRGRSDVDEARPGTGRRRVGRRIGLAVVALVVAVGVAGCASSEEKYSATSGAIQSVGEADASVATGDASTAPAAEGASLNTDALGQIAPPADRPVISSATMTVETDDVAGTKPRALAIVAAKKGYLFADESSYGEEAVATLTVKVPPAVFSETIEDLGGLGELRSQ